MARLKISLAGFDYDRTRTIFDGTVPVEGCDVVALALSSEETFNWAFKHREFEVAGISKATEKRST